MFEKLYKRRIQELEDRNKELEAEVKGRQQQWNEWVPEYYELQKQKNELIEKNRELKKENIVLMERLYRVLKEATKE